MKTLLFFVSALLFALIAGPTSFGAENAIVRENKNEGTTNWLFNWNKVISPGSDDLWKREKGIEGYCSHASIRAGETLKVFVSTEPAAPFARLVAHCAMN